MKMSGMILLGLSATIALDAALRNQRAGRRKRRRKLRANRVSGLILNPDGPNQASPRSASRHERRSTTSNHVRPRKSRDLAVVPGAESIIASGNREGGRIHLIKGGRKTSMVLFPTATRIERLDAATYQTCPDDSIARSRIRSERTATVANPGRVAATPRTSSDHGTREPIEVYEVDAGATPPGKLTWRRGARTGCRRNTFNAVVAIRGRPRRSNSRAGDVASGRVGPREGSDGAVVG